MEGSFNGSGEFGAAEVAGADDTLAVEEEGGGPVVDEPGFGDGAVIAVENDRPCDFIFFELGERFLQFCVARDFDDGDRLLFEVFHDFPIFVRGVGREYKKDNLTGESGGVDRFSVNRVSTKIGRFVADEEVVDLLKASFRIVVPRVTLLCFHELA